MRAIITGFERFGPYPINPTGELASKFEGQVVGNVKFSGLVLPATYRTAVRDLFGAIEELEPAFVISFGLASRIPRLRIEAFGRNWMQSTYADNLGVLATGEKIDPEGPNFCQTNIDAIGLVHALHETDVAVDISVDAEAFVCNALIYQTMRRLRHPSEKTLFTYFHTPWPDRYCDRITLGPGKVTIPWETLEKTTRITALFLHDEVVRAR